MQDLISIFYTVGTWQCGLNYTNTDLQRLQDKEKIFPNKNNIRGGISSVFADSYVKSDDNQKKIYIDANNFYGHNHCLMIKLNLIKNVNLEDILNSAYDSDIGYSVEVDLPDPDIIKEQTKKLPFAPENRKLDFDNTKPYMNGSKPNFYTQTMKFICDLTDNKKSLNNYRMSKFYVKQGMTFDRVHEIISFKRGKCLDKFMSFSTQKG